MRIKGKEWAQKTKVKLKILAPMGITLSPHETVILSKMFQNDVRTLEDNDSEVEQAIDATVRSLGMTNSLTAARAARSQAVTNFKKTKDPIKKREWARRLVIADQTIQSVRDVKMRLGATKDRLVMIKGDMELQLIEAEARAAEMRAYASAGKSLRLAGEKLMQARSRANKVSVEYDNLEVTMEGAETMAGKLSPQTLLLKAKQIIDRGNEEAEEDTDEGENRVQSVG